jgi:predicted alpha/beta hydrolase
MNADTDLIHYRAADGVEASARVFRAGDRSAAVIVCLPAMGVRADYYAGLAQLLCREGFTVVLSDLRGIGRSSVRASARCDFGYREILELDLPALIEAVRQEFPHSDRVLLGHSLGGQLGALFLGAHPEAAKALILIASGSVYFKGWRFPRRLRVLAMALLLRLLGAMFGYVPGDKVGFAGTEAKRVVVDWSNNCFSGRHAVAGSAFDYEKAMRALVKPVLAISFAKDDLAPPRSVQNLLDKLPQCAVTAHPYAADHPGLERLGHFNWTKRIDVIVPVIAGWVATDAGKSLKS